jgi:hypothetical protein
VIVSCPVCPRVALAVQKDSPLIEILKSGLKTRAFEDHVKQIRELLEQRGVRSSVLSMYAPIPMMCLWTQGQRKRLMKRAKEVEAVLVLGCDSATYTVRQALKDTECKIIQAMRMTGITNATVKFQFPINVTFQEKTRVGTGEKTSAA